jgi:two-component system chemotaxis sensor kinase CheA
MGMDIVVSKIESINGTIEIDSTPGEGTKVTIKLPLTMAILTSIVARIGEGVYAIPLEAVAEIITVRRKDVQFVNRKQVVRLRDRVVPIATFEDIFDTQLPDLQTKSRDREEFRLVIVGFDNEQIGLVVDDLLGQEDVVIKSLTDNYRNVRGIAGASIRGDGTVSLILDIGTMMEMNELKVEGAVTSSNTRAASTCA